MFRGFPNNDYKSTSTPSFANLSTHMLGYCKQYHPGVLFSQPSPNGFHDIPKATPMKTFSFMLIISLFLNILLHNIPRYSPYLLSTRFPFVSFVLASYIVYKTLYNHLEKQSEYRL